MLPHHAVVAHLFQFNLMRIASWNVNSAKARLGIIINWLKLNSCDVLLLQETKSQDENFPRDAFSSLGWHVTIHGQKSYNGVAIASRHPIKDVLCGLPGDDSDEQARYIEATIDGIRIASLYLPNGNPTPGDKFDYKLAWMESLLGPIESPLTFSLDHIAAGNLGVTRQALPKRNLFPKD